MTDWQIQIHVVLTKNHASSECCSQITTIIIHIQEKQNKESVGGKKSLNGIYGMQNIIHNRIPKRQRWHSGIHPFWYTQSCVYTLPWAHVLPTQLFWFSYLQIPAGIHWVSRCEHQFPPRKTKFFALSGLHLLCI